MRKIDAYCLGLAAQQRLHLCIRAYICKRCVQLYIHGLLLRRLSIGIEKPHINAAVLILQRRYKLFAVGLGRLNNVRRHHGRFVRCGKHDTYHRLCCVRQAVQNGLLVVFQILCGKDGLGRLRVGQNLLFRQVAQNIHAAAGKR